MMPDIENRAGDVAVITGAASGIGFAAAKRFAERGMQIVMLDRDEAQLNDKANLIGKITKVYPFLVDVSNKASVLDTADDVKKTVGPISLLFANAGIQPGSSFDGDVENWQRILDVNFWGIVHTVNGYLDGLNASGHATKILITGSKQGITTPPGDPAYNISKAALKVYAEALEHDLRNRPNNKVSVHLVIPGFVWTPLTYNGRSQKPDGAWTADETFDFVLNALDQNQFYILCPDNDVNRALDEKRIEWAAADIIKSRPPLSRWHHDFKEAFAQFLKK